MHIKAHTDGHGLRYYAVWYQGRMLGVWSGRTRAMREGIQMIVGVRA